MIVPWLVVVLAAAAPPRFSAESDAIRLDVVVARKGEPIVGLTAADFEVTDDGRARRVTLASRVEESVHAVLVFDISGSVEGDPIARLKSAAGAFVSSLDPTDRVTLVTFSQRLRRVVGPAEPREAQDVLPSLEVEHGTGLYDAAFAGVTVARTAPGRPFVLLFTDGYDYLSWLGPEDALDTARETEATVYLVCTAPVATGSATADVRERFLKQIVGDTGGRIWTPGREIRDAFLEVLAEVKNRYLLVFERDPTARPGWHEIKVRLKNRKGEVRARKGYFVRQEGR